MTDKWLPISMLAVAISLYAARNSGLFTYSHGSIDTVLGVLALMLVAWLLWPSSKPRDGNH